jgi:endonuclease/exonuclease/phosphatase family metal-dependent hydrolase
MWRSVLSRLTSADPLSRCVPATLLALLLAGCGPRVSGVSAYARPAPLRPDAGEFSVMTYNLRLYGAEDREGGGPQADPKPEAERAALVAVLAAERPAVLALQEMGGPEFFASFRAELKSHGLDYPHAEYVQRGRQQANLALLSRFPISAREPHTNDVYRIGAAQVPVARGFLDVTIAVNRDYTFRILVAHLKSKVFHQLGQTEMRRNEARLLNNHVRAALKGAPALNLLVVGDLNDAPESAALHEVRGGRLPCLEDVRPADAWGDVWTHCAAQGDEYGRLDYILVSRGMQPELVREKTYAIRHPLMLRGSDHRPIMAVFKAHERGQAAAGG